ncbi:MAG: hypothetical protein KAI99_15130, partial [Cyclobacteriaceae bacterium]|nr:hypothetical protein [Cyclobacteriaceae bacterium]
DFTAIKERVEKNPSRKNLKTQKSRKSYFRASSNQKHKSFGSDVILKRNSKLSNKYSSMVIISSKGNSKIKSPKRDYRKSSKKIQKHSGNIFLQPEAKKKDYNEIKTRVEKNPGRSMAKHRNRQKNRTIANTSLTQTYKGDINVKAQRAKKQTYKYDSRAMQKSSGNLRAQSIKSDEKRRKYYSKSSASFKGDVVLPARNHKRLKYEYMSKASQKHKGELKRPAKTPGPQYTAKWSGDLKSISKKSKDQWKKYETKRQTLSAGDLNARKNRQKSRGNPLLTQNIGGIKVYSRSGQKKLMKRDSKITGSYSGNIRVMSKKYRNQELQGKSMNFTGDEGNVKVLSKKKQDKFMSGNSKTSGAYSGNMRAMSKKTRNQELQGKSMNITGEEGNMKVPSKKRQDKF